MPINLGSIILAMRARDSQFRSSMRRSAEAVRAQERTLKSLRRTVYRTNQRFRQFRSSVLSLRGAVGVLAGSAGLGLIIKRSLDTADSIAKTADAVGISTAALQELRFAADLSGVSIDGLDKALKFATKSIGELRTRTSSELTTALKDFDAQLLSNIKNAGSVEEALNLTFKRMGELEDATKKAAVAKAVFGRAGIDLVNIVRGGAGALEEMRREAQRLGIVIDDDLLRKAERAKDSLTILSTVLRTRVTQAVVENAEKIDRLAQALTERLPGALDAVSRQAQVFADNTQALKETVLVAGVALGGRFVAQTIKAVIELKRLTAATVAARIGLATLGGPLGWVLLGASALGYFALRAKDSAKKTTEFTQRLKELQNAVRGMASEGVAALQANIEQTKTLLAGISKDIEDEQKKLQDRLDRIRGGERERSDPGALRGFRTRIAELKRDLEETEQFLEQLHGRFDSIRSKQETIRVAELRQQAAAEASDFSDQILAGIKRENLLARQRLDLLKVEGAARFRLQAEQQISNQLEQEHRRLTDEVTRAQKRLSAAGENEKEAARASVLIAQDRLAAFDKTRDQQGLLTEELFEQLKLGQQAADIEAKRRQQEAVRTAVLEANLSHQQQTNQLLDEALQMEKESLALKQRLAGQDPVEADPTREGVQKRAVELVRQMLDARARGDEAAEAAARAAILSLKEYEEGLRRRNDAEKDLNDSKRKNLALDQAQELIAANTKEEFRKQVELEIRKLENANKLATAEGTKRFELQQQFKSEERIVELMATAAKLRKKGNDDAAEALRDHAVELSKLILNNELLTDELREQLRLALEKAGVIKKENEEAKHRLEFAQRTAQALTKGLEAAILSGKKFSDVLRDIGKEMLRIVLRVLVLRRLEDFLTVTLSGKGKAAGGPVAAGQLTLVGEGGPEFIRPAVPSVVTPNYKLRAAMAAGAAGGPSLTLNFNIESTDGPGVQAALDRAIPGILQQAAEVAERLVGTSLSRKSPLRRKLLQG